MVVRAIFEKGVFRPLQPVTDLTEHCEVILSVRKPVDLKTLQSVRGTISTDDAIIMQGTIDEGRRVEGNW